MLVGLSAASDRIFVTADANQSIYGSGFRWIDVHADLRFQGRTGVLRKNYRTTREIGEAAQAYLQGGALDEEAIERTYAQYDGPLPVIRAARGAAAERELLVRFLRLGAKEARQGLGACAVLVPSEAAGRGLADRLTQAGVPAQCMPGRRSVALGRDARRHPRSSFWPEGPSARTGRAPRRAHSRAGCRTSRRFCAASLGGDLNGGGPVDPSPAAFAHRAMAMQRTSAWVPYRSHI